MRVPLAATVLVVALCLASACRDAPSAARPEVALERLQAAVAASDGPAVYALFDHESRGYYTDQVRTWRASVESGAAVADVLPPGLGWSRDELLAGSAEDVAARLLGSHSTFATLGDWFQQATVLETAHEADDEARLTLVGPDGAQRDIWFVRQSDGWAYDHYRSRW